MNVELRPSAEIKPYEHTPSQRPGRGGRRAVDQAVRVSVHLGPQPVKKAALTPRRGEHRESMLAGGGDTGNESLPELLGVRHPGRLVQDDAGSITLDSGGGSGDRDHAPAGRQFQQFGRFLDDPDGPPRGGHDQRQQLQAAAHELAALAFRGQGQDGGLPGEPRRERPRRPPLCSCRTGGP